MVLNPVSSHFVTSLVIAWARNSQKVCLKWRKWVGNGLGTNDLGTKIFGYEMICYPEYIRKESNPYSYSAMATDNQNEPNIRKTSINNPVRVGSRLFLRVSTHLSPFILPILL